MALSRFALSHFARRLTATVHLLAPTRLQIAEYNVEWVVNQTISIHLAIFTVDPDTKEEIMFSDCSDVNVEVTLSNNKDFVMKDKSSKFKD